MKRVLDLRTVERSKLFDDQQLRVRGVTAIARTPFGVEFADSSHGVTEFENGMNRTEKCGTGASLLGVRIPPSPPLTRVTQFLHQ